MILYAHIKNKYRSQWGGCIVLSSVRLGFVSEIFICILQVSEEETTENVMK